MAKVTCITAPADQAAEKAAWQAKIDRYGELDRLNALQAPNEAERKVLGDEIQKRHKDDASDQNVVESGLIYQIQLTPRRNERTLFDKRKAFNFLKKALGLDGLIAVIEIPLGSVIDKNVPKSAQHAFVSEERSGYRTLTVVPLHEATIPELPEVA